MIDASIDGDERLRRWKLVLGSETEDLSERDQRLAQALAQVYDSGADGERRSRRNVGHGASAPRVARWLGDIREFFPSAVVQVIHKDAFERLGLKQMLLEPEFLAAVEADVNLIADLIALRSAMPDKTKETARQVVAKVVRELLEKLETIEAVRGALNKQKRTSRPRFSDISPVRSCASRCLLGALPPCMASGRSRATRIVPIGRRDRVLGVYAMTKWERPFRSSTSPAVRPAPRL
jgi:hypothetical protein